MRRRGKKAQINIKIQQFKFKMIQKNAIIQSRVKHKKRTTQFLNNDHKNLPIIIGIYSLR